MSRYFTWKRSVFVVWGLLLVVGIRFVMHLLLPRNFPTSEQSITLKLEGGPLACRFYDTNQPQNGVVVVATGDGGWSYWEDNTANSLAANGYIVIGWDCRVFAIRELTTMTSSSTDSTPV